MLKTNIVTLCILSVALCSLGLVSSQPAQATPALRSEDFNPGRIIDDHIFVDKDSMSVEDIQRFLEDRVQSGSCDRNRVSRSESAPQPPYTCLFEFQQNIETGESNYGLFDDNGNPTNIDEGKSAAQIIWDVAQENSINPQVLLVVLQKESALITDNWPWPNQFNRATGYGCPDNEECDPEKAGFYKQIRHAAWQFRQYIDNLDRYWYSIGPNRLYYNPDQSCGYEVIDIENAATVALYLYTPFIPNEAAMNNLFGQGDNCSSYSARNFWVLFNRWFGSPIDNTDQTVTTGWNSGFHFTVTKQTFYQDADKTIALGNWRLDLQPNQTVYASIEVQNISLLPWSVSGDYPVALHAQSNNQSSICDDNQTACQNIIQPTEENISYPGVAVYEFRLTAPEEAGSHQEEFLLKSNEFRLRGETPFVTLNVAGQRVSTPTPITSNPTTPDDNTNSQPTTAVLPANWNQMSVREKIASNPWGCHDTTKIRADNGQCLSGGYTIPSNTVADSSNTNDQTASDTTTDTTASDTAPTTPDDNTNSQPTTAVLPANWNQMSVREKIASNPWGCHDTTKIRADNGQCLSGGYTIPSNTVADSSNTNDQTASDTTTDTTSSDTTTNTNVTLPANWNQMSVREKIASNPWGCHDTTKIRADNGQCLSGGYTIPS